MAEQVLYGCANPDCGYRTLPSTMGTPYTRCPLCDGVWVRDPPPANAQTGKSIVTVNAAGKVTKRTVVRPHLQESFDRLERRHE